MDYTYRIEQSDDGAAWELAPDGAMMSSTGTISGGESPDEMAAFVARNQSCATGDLWRVRVWSGATADTSQPPAAEVVHDERT